jgi:hypothetical protein
VTYQLAAPALPPDHFGHHAVLLDWDTEFIGWTRGKLAVKDVFGLRIPLPGPWRPGDHWANCGVTGDGKSTHCVGLLKTRKWVLALDPKGEDETLDAAGYIRIRSMPPPRKLDRQIWDRVNKGLPVGLVVGFDPRDDQEDQALKEALRDAITWCRRTRGWTLYVDEFELLSSQRMYRMGPDIERMLITARRAGTSVLTSFQAPAWVSKHATRQARLTTMWATTNQQMIKAIGESTGRDWKEVAAVLDELPKFHSLTIPRGSREPMIVTRAPKVA